MRHGWGCGGGVWIQSTSPCTVHNDFPTGREADLKDIEMGPPQYRLSLGRSGFEQQFTLSLMESKEKVLEEIAAAWDRIDQGTFGRCEECGKEIPKARLLVLPFTSYCVECARVVQRSD